MPRKLTAEQKLRNSEYMRAWRARNREHCREQDRQKAKRYRDKNLEKVRSQAREKTRRNRLKALGMTPEDLIVLIAELGDRCGICGTAFDGVIANGANARRTGRNIDHDHNTGKVRGLLCGQCNTSLGKLGDNEEMIQRVLDYLHRAKERA